MFLSRLRQLTIRRSLSEVEITYHCKTCNRLVRVALVEQEFDDLQNGIPFGAVFSGKRLVEFYHFRKGLCVDHA